MLNFANELNIRQAKKNVFVKRQRMLNRFGVKSEMLSVKTVHSQACKASLM